VGFEKPLIFEKLIFPILFKWVYVTVRFKLFLTPPPPRIPPPPYSPSPFPV
jgi:hypothetical protein